MPEIDPHILGFAVALGIGLLIGTERERRKGGGPDGTVAGLRTFSIAGLTGALAFMVGGGLLLATATAAVAGLVALSYWRRADENPGLTTELTLVLTVLLGGFAMVEPVPAGGLGVTVAVLLAARSPLHGFVQRVLTQDELRDALTFAAATLIILPMLPDRELGPFGAFNPARIWIIVILVMAIGGIGHIAVRALGPQSGLALAGFAGGFISSTATIGAMGSHARKHADDRDVAVAGAVLSTVATVVQMAIVLAATSLPVLYSMAVPLALAGVAAAAYGAAFTIRALKRGSDSSTQPGRAFRLITALLFAGMLAVILFGSAALQHYFGAGGTLLAAAAAGFADTHAPAISVASLTHGDASAAMVPILAAFTTNSVSKAVFAWVGGGAGFALRVILVSCWSQPPPGAACC